MPGILIRYGNSSSQNEHTTVVVCSRTAKADKAVEVGSERFFAGRGGGVTFFCGSGGCCW